METTQPRSEKFSLSISPKSLLALSIVVAVALLAVFVSVRFKAGRMPFPEEVAAFERVENALVAGFPDVPFYPEASILYSYRKTDDGRIGFEAHFETVSDAQTVARWYLSTFEANEWAVVDRPEALDAGELYIAAEGAKTSAHIFLDQEDEKTGISIEIPVQ